MRFLYFLIPALLLAVGACTPKKAQVATSNDIIYIPSEQDDCFHAYQDIHCLAYTTAAGSDEILVHKGEIKGFDYEEGYSYVIEVSKESKDGVHTGNWILTKVIEKNYDPDAYQVPENITANYYKNARIKLDKSTQFYSKIVPGSGLVLEFKRKAAYDRRIADANLTEIVLIEIENQDGDFTINGIKEAVQAYYSKLCFCEYTGPAPMNDFTVTGKKVGDKYEIDIQIPPQNMDLINMGVTLENIPYVRETRNFKAEYSQGSVFDLIQEETSASNPYANLQGAWELEQLDGKQAAELVSDWDLPLIELQLDELVYFGNDGCNLIRGNLVVEGKSIFFESGISTRKYCEGAIDTEFMNAFTKVNSYQLVADRLILMKDQKALMVLKKK